MKILFISDQSLSGNNTAVEGFFYKALNNQKDCTVDVVYFDENKDTASIIGPHKILLPKKVKRYQIVQALESLLNLNDYQVIIVYNFFTVLSQLTPFCKKNGIKIGFWETFPHNYCRLEKAKRIGKSVLRKSIEWYFKGKHQRKLISQCDFYLPNSKTMYHDFYDGISVPIYPLTVGIDTDDLPRNIIKNYQSKIKTFVYIGAIDIMRDFDLILKAFMSIESEFVFNIYSSSNDAYVKHLKAISKNDNRIVWHNSLHRKKLFQEIASFDIGIGLIPDTKVYRCSLATKTLEYYSLGLVTILNHLPSYDELFDESSSFFCDFNVESIKQTIENIIHYPKEELFEMGKKGQEIVLREKNYNNMAEGLIQFLKLN